MMTPSKAEFSFYHPQEAPQDSASTSTAFDSVWASSELPVQQPLGTEKFMLAEDKLFVVLAVVLIIWFGIVYFILRTDRKITRLEEQITDQ